jgi:hypothetical protein
VTTNCPHPEKHRHVSAAAALAHRESLETARGIDLALKPYPCGDHWHIGHPKKKRQLELKQALKAGVKASRAARRRRKR